MPLAVGHIILRQTITVSGSDSESVVGIGICGRFNCDQCQCGCMAMDILIESWVHLRGDQGRDSE